MVLQLGLFLCLSQTSEAGQGLRGESRRLFHTTTTGQHTCGWCSDVEENFTADNVVAYECLGIGETASSHDECMQYGAQGSQPITCGSMANFFHTAEQESNDMCPYYRDYMVPACCTSTASQEAEQEVEQQETPNASCEWCNGFFSPDTVTHYNCYNADGSAMQELKDGELVDMTVTDEVECSENGGSSIPVTCSMMDTFFGQHMPDMCMIVGFQFQPLCCSHVEDAPSCEWCPAADFKPDNVTFYECLNEHGDQMKEMRDGEEDDMSRPTANECHVMGAQSTKPITCGMMDSFIAAIMPTMCPAVGSQFGRKCCHFGVAASCDWCPAGDFHDDRVVHYDCFNSDGSRMRDDNDDNDDDDKDLSASSHEACMEKGAARSEAITCGMMDGYAFSMSSTTGGAEGGCQMFGAMGVEAFCCGEEPSGPLLYASHDDECSRMTESDHSPDGYHCWNDKTDNTPDVSPVDPTGETCTPSCLAHIANVQQTCNAVRPLDGGSTDAIVHHLTHHCGGSGDCPHACGPGTVEHDGTCFGSSATCVGLWPAGMDAHYTPTHSCQCNDLCEAYGNCCVDYTPPRMCETFGNPQHYVPENKCQCNELCTHYGNCCMDSAWN